MNKFQESILDSKKTKNSIYILQKERFCLLFPDATRKHSLLHRHGCLNESRKRHCLHTSAILDCPCKIYDDTDTADLFSMKTIDDQYSVKKNIRQCYRGDVLKSYERSQSKHRNMPILCRLIVIS